MRTYLTFTLSLFLVLLIPNFTQAQTIQLGAGTGESWNQNSSPVNIYYRRTVCQFVYTAQELQEAYASSVNPITQLGFFVTESPIYTLRQYTIKLKHVNVNNVASPLGTNGWTTVLGPFNYSPTSGGWDMLTLDTPFQWNGTSSIGVEICWSRVNPTWNASGTVRIYGTANGYRYSTSDNNGSSCGSVPTTVTTDKPQIQMIFVPGSTTNWTGAVSTDWFNHNNWSAGIPNPIMNAVIPAGLTNYPALSGSGAKCKNITIAAGASLEIVGTDSLSIYGNWNNLGTFTDNESTVLFKGFGVTPNLVNGALSQEFYNFEVRSNGGVSLVTGSYNIRGSLRLRGGTFLSNNLVTLISDVNNTGRLTRIANFCDYELDMNDTYGDGWNGGYITFRVDGQIVSYYNAEGTGSSVSLPLPDGADFTIEYSAGRYENENSYSISDNSGSVIFSDGSTPSTGLIYSGTATCPFNNTYTGTLGVQRYLNLPNNEWRELSSGLAGQTLLDYNNDGLIMTNFTGSNYPNFGWTSVYSYNENNANGVKENGWAAATNITNAVYPSKGHRIYIGSGVYTTRMLGVPIVGDFSYNLDYQNVTSAELAANEDQKGWNLIGNPYPCTVSWDSIDASNKVNIDDAIWVWSGSAGNYGVYVGEAGSGTNDVSNYIASSQAFWVHATSGGASLLIEEEDKAERDPVFVKSGNTPTTQLKIQLTSSMNTFKDEIVIGSNPVASDSSDRRDAQKLFSSLPQAPQLYMLFNDQYLSINTLQDFSLKRIPLGVFIPADGNYKISFKNLLETEGIGCLLLVDQETGYIHDVWENNEFSFSSNSGTFEDRFVIYLDKNASENPYNLCENMSPTHFSSVDEQKISHLKLHPNPSSLGFVNIEGDENILSAAIIDLSGRQLDWIELNDQSAVINTSHLASGIYFLKVYFENTDELIKFEVNN